MVKIFQHTSVLKVGCDRNFFFTNHGLHLNAQGKQMLSKLIISNIYSIF